MADESKPAAESKAAAGSFKTILIVVLGITAVAFLISTIVLFVDDSSKSSTAESTTYSNVPDNNFYDTETIFEQNANSCDGAKLQVANVDCVHTPGPQAGANVTKGFEGGMNVTYDPNTDNYWESSMCAVNVHWHLGTEHYSVGQYDENGDGPSGNIALSRKLEGRAGFRCHYYDADDSKFTSDYQWKHCVDMEVGETYEVHWPHSAAGACGTVDQYQTPFYDGVFCNLDAATFGTLSAQQIANAVGVQAQIFTVVNDEQYFYPDLIRGWIVDGDYGSDIAYYTGSTTSDSRNNDVCSSYTPITWQVDRKCHMISASSFDKLCYDMKLQRDDMSGDLLAHGSRELVSREYVANNQHRRGLRADQAHAHAHGDDHHDHDHHHHQWF